MTNKTTQELVALLTDPVLKEAAGYQLLQQSPSIDDLECHSARTLRVLESRFEKYDLVICDVLGYISFDKQGAEMFLIISL
jgi:hypothetical protein